MKKLFLSLVALMASAVSFCQNNLVATLTHGDDITMYYGIYALRSAMSAAQSGDVINLSGGSFQSVDISKAVSLRGTGIDDGTPTYIVGGFTINIPVEDTLRFSMEGIRCDNGIYLRGGMRKPYFFRCKFQSFDSGDSIKQVRFVNCKIFDGMNLRNNAEVEFINTYMYRIQNYNPETASAIFLNCIVGTDYWFSEFGNCQLLNCIVFDYTGNNGSLPATSIVMNCVGINSNSIFNDSQLNTNCKYASYDIFKDWTGGYTDEWSFELTDEAKATYLGDDGDQVGMYGGSIPYTSTPTYPQITKMNVAGRTTADGKLSVEIEVSASESE